MRRRQQTRKENKESDGLDFYSEETVSNSFEDDGISDAEQAFMLGYLYS